MNEELKDGFYWIKSPSDPRPSLVRVYTNPDSGKRGVGFGIWDGSAFIAFDELSDESILKFAIADPEDYE